VRGGDFCFENKPINRGGGLKKLNSVPFLQFLS